MKEISAQTGAKRCGPRRGSAVIWPAGVQERYGISAETRWRWEWDGWLPQRDVHIGRRSGWRPATLEKAESVAIHAESRQT